MSFLGLTFDKLLLIGLLAVLLIGPDKLPMAAEKFGHLVRGIRDMANGARDRMREEMGPEFDEVDWQKLDPRQYDPRRIVREALLDDPQPTTPVIKRDRAAPTSRGASQQKSGSIGFAAAAAAASVQVIGAASTETSPKASDATSDDASTVVVGAPAPFDNEAT